MRIVITGASGLLGRHIYCYFKRDSRWSSVIGTCFSRKGSNSELIPYDLTRPEECARVIQEHKPDIIIHCAAERRPDVVEKQAEQSRQLNVTATQSLASLMDQCGGVLIYISTDYVFDGNNPPYDENSQPNPLNLYGKSKLEGENEVLTLPKNVVLRVPILYGDVEYIEESAVTVLFPKVKDIEKECVMSNYERRYPVHCQDIAACLNNFLISMTEKKHGASSYTGIFHFSADEEMTKYDMAMTMAQVFGISTSHIKPDNEKPSGGTQRPYNSQLSCKRLKDLGVFPEKLTPFTEGIKAVLSSYAQGQ